MRTELKQNEKVVFETKTHWFSIVLPLIFCFILLIISLFLINTSSIVGYFILAFSIVYFIFKIYYRKFNIWVVTNNRIIDERGVFSIKIIESPLEKLNNLDYSQSLIGRIFKFGTVNIQTAANNYGNGNKFIVNPKGFKDSVTNMKDELSKSQNKYNRDEFSNNNDKSSELDKLHHLKEKGAISEDEYITLKSKIINS